MKGIELLSLTGEQKKFIETSELNYRRFAHVHFTIISANDTEIVVKVIQNKAEKYLTAKELIDRTKEVFNFLGKKVHVRPIPYQADGLENYGFSEIEKDIKEFGLQLKDLVELTGINKASLSRLLNGGREFTKIQKALFYYLFRYLKEKRK